MSDRHAHALLTALRRTSGQIRLYGRDHPLTTAGVHETARAADLLAGESGRAVLTILDDSIYLDREVLATTSLEFNSLIRAFQQQGIESITITPPVAAEDIGRLAETIAGAGDPADSGTSLALNQNPWGRGDLGGAATAGLRSAYASSLDLLRNVGGAVSGHGDVNIADASSVVRGLLEHTISQPGAALLLANVKSHHEYTFYHSVNTCILSLGLGRLADLSEPDLMTLGLGALLHDIGKLGVSAAVLQHPGRLGPEQWREIRRHPQIGAAAILASAGTGNGVVAAIAFEHHASFDGSGYPRLVYHDHVHADGHHGARRTQHFFSRLVAVADTYDAITTRRAYRRAEPPGRALHVLLETAGASYDPDVVLSFIHLMGVYPPGSLLRLRRGEVVMVTEPAPDPDVAPAAVLVADAAGAALEHPETIEFDRTDITEPLSAAEAGIDTGAVLHRVGVTVETV